MRKLFVDLGHSKRFPGAIGIRSEVEWTRDIWSALKPMLDGKRWEVVEVPTDYVSDWSASRQLVNRINWINKRSRPEDFLLSIHANGFNDPRANGVETCYFTGSKIAEKCATELTKSIAKATGCKIRGDGAYEDTAPPRGRIAMVRDTVPFALLVECGFVSSKKDMTVPAAKYAEGIANYFNTFYGV